MSNDAHIIDLGDGYTPNVSPDAWIAPTAVVVGNVTLSAGVSVWYNAVLRGDNTPIVIGADSNLQDGVVVHVDPGASVTLGRGVSVGHNAVIHGATVEDGCLIGMGATLLNGSVIGSGSLVAANALVPQGMIVPPGSLVAGVPAKVRRPLTDDEKAGLVRNAQVYLAHTKRHRSAIDS